jgi:hypothetical protein
MNSWEKIWDESGPPLTRRGADPNIPPLTFGSSTADEQCGLSNDGTRILFPIFLGFNPAPFDVVMIPLPEIMDIAFFEKMAAFIVRIKQVTRIPSVARLGPISWDVGGFIDNVIEDNEVHLRHVNGFNNVIIGRILEDVDLILEDWNGEHSNGRISHVNFFVDEDIDEDDMQLFRDNIGALFFPPGIFD